MKLLEILKILTTKMSGSLEKLLHSGQLNQQSYPKHNLPPSFFKGEGTSRSHRMFDEEKADLEEEQDDDDNEEEDTDVGKCSSRTAAS